MNRTRKPPLFGDAEVLVFRARDGFRQWGFSVFGHAQIVAVTQKYWFLKHDMDFDSGGFLFWDMLRLS